MQTHYIFHDFLANDYIPVAQKVRSAIACASTQSVAIYMYMYTVCVSVSDIFLTSLIP